MARGGKREGAGAKKGGTRTIGWETQSRRFLSLRFTESEYNVIMAWIGKESKTKWLKNLILSHIGLKENA